MNNLQGQLLVAAPRFIGTLPRAVVLVTEHTAEVATGVVLNHPLNEQILRSCLEMYQSGKTPAVALKLMQPQIPGLQISEPDLPEIETEEDRCRSEQHCHERNRDPHEELDADALPSGVEPSSSLVPGEQAASPTIQIPVGVLVAPTGLVGGRMNDKVPPMFRVVIGQVGWKNADLEAELVQGQWMTTPATPDLLFTAHDDLWQTAVRRVGQEALFHGFGIRPAQVLELN